jgi:hypothetical protein
VQQGANAKAADDRQCGGGRRVHDREQDICVELSTLEDLPQRHHHFGRWNHGHPVDDGRAAQNFQRRQRRDNDDDACDRSSGQPK